MYCPQCGTSQSDELKFCNLCGANLFAVRQVVATRETDERFDWSKTWVADMFLSEEERKKRKQQLERQSGITEEVKQANEVKNGVIASCVGIALMVFLFVFMRGLIKSGYVEEGTAEILRHVWIAGIFPFMGGIGLVINELVFSKRLRKAAQKELSARTDASDDKAQSPYLRPADTTEFITPDFSVTEETTKHLRSSRQKQ
jgi:hypothetical protein